MLSSHTFAERLYNCSSFKQDKNYDRIIQNVNMDIIKQNRAFSQDSINNSYFSILYQKFKKWSNSLQLILKEDKQQIEDLLITYIENVSKFLHKFNVDFNDNNYIFKGKISGNIIGLTVIKGIEYNIDISYKNITDTFYHLYYHKLNFFLYNKAKNKTNDGLIYIVSTNTMYLIKYNLNDYTMNRGFVEYNIKNRAVRPGHQCLYCSVKNCKPRLITDINRFLI